MSDSWGAQMSSQSVTLWRKGVYKKHSHFDDTKCVREKKYPVVSKYLTYSSQEESRSGCYLICIPSRSEPNDRLVWFLEHQHRRLFSGRALDVLPTLSTQLGVTQRHKAQRCEL